jgi:hypothetical protein
MNFTCLWNLHFDRLRHRRFLFAPEHLVGAIIVSQRYMHTHFFFYQIANSLLAGAWRGIYGSWICVPDNWLTGSTY